MEKIGQNYVGFNFRTGNKVEIPVREVKEIANLIRKAALENNFEAFVDAQRKLFDKSENASFMTLAVAQESSFSLAKLLQSGVEYSEFLRWVEELRKSYYESGKSFATVLRTYA